MSEFDTLKAALAAERIAFAEHERPRRIECARTVAFFTDSGDFTHWVARDEPLVMVAREAVMPRGEKPS